MNKFLCCLLLASSASYAGEYVSDAQIDNLRVRTWVTYIKLDKCTKYSRIKLDDEYGKAMYSAALTAFASGKKVKVSLVEPDGCNTTESEIEYIDIAK